MSILKGFGRLVVRFDVQDGFPESLLNTTVSRKVILFSDISAVNLIRVGWNPLAFNKTIQKQKTSSTDVTSPFS